MAKDDMFRIIYCILKELYECMKQGVGVKKEDISYERFGVPYSYWIDIIIQMQEKGFISGVKCRMTKGTGRIINYDDISITFEGVEYIEENSMMKKVKETLQNIKDIVPGL